MGESSTESGKARVAASTKCRAFSATISTSGPQAEGVLRSAEVVRFPTVALAEHRLWVPATSVNQTSCGGSLIFAVVHQQPSNLRIRSAARQAAPVKPHETTWRLPFGSREQHGRRRALWVPMESTFGETQARCGASCHGVHDTWIGRIMRQLGKHVGARQPLQETGTWPLARWGKQK